MKNKTTHGTVTLANNEFKAMLTEAGETKAITLISNGTIPSIVDGKVVENPRLFCTIIYEGSAYKIEFQNYLIAPYELMAAHDLLFSFPEKAEEIRRNETVKHDLCKVKKNA